MAFGNDDTDKFYEKLILPVLKKNNITPVIINRHHSNDDLNFLIIQKLREADFCIVDLTYTRPSVYYEAGFASARDIEVIYTVRKDHLNKNQPDDKRVHFDVQMKPIIDWKSPEDLSFSRRLETRIIKTFLSKWLRMQKTITTNKKEEEKFSSLSTLSRLIRTRRLFIEAINKQGYNKKNWIKNNFYSNGYDDEVVIGAQAEFENCAFIYKIKGENLYVTTLQAYKSPTKKELIEIHRMYGSTYFLSNTVRKLFADKKVKKLCISIFVLSLDTISSKRIETALPNAIPVVHSKHYKIGNISKPGIADLYFLSGIKSENQLKKDLQKLVLP